MHSSTPRLGGEQVVLMRGAKHVAAIVPISADDLELLPRLTDDQAARLWSRLAEERSRGSVSSFRTPDAAVSHLERAPVRQAGKAKSRARRAS